MRIIFAKFEIVLLLNFNLNKVEIFTIDCSGHWICKKTLIMTIIHPKRRMIVMFSEFDPAAAACYLKRSQLFWFLSSAQSAFKMAFRNINVSKNCLVIFWEERLEKERFSRANRMSRRLLKCQENWRILSHTQGK